MEYIKTEYLTVSITAMVAILLMAALVIAPAPPEEVATSASVSVNEFISITLTSGYPVTFGSQDPGATYNATNNPLVVTIGSETNINYDITTEANATSFIGPANLTVGNMTWSPDTNTYTSYSTSPAVVASGSLGGGSQNIYHQLTIPSLQAAGSYTVGVTVTATSV